VGNPLLARLIRKGGGKLLDLATDQAPADDSEKPSLKGKFVGAALARVATRSVPGAIVVGAGVIAKALYDRRHARKGKGGNGAA
jgi:hypothetical protein